MSDTPRRDGLAAIWAPLPDDDETPPPAAGSHPIWHDAELLPRWRIDTIHAPTGDHQA